MERIVTSEKKTIDAKSTLLNPNNMIKFYKKVNIMEVIADRLENPGSNFIDDNFPPNSDSLYGKNKTRENIESTYEEDMQSLNKDKNWMSSADLFDSILITRNEFSPSDLIQGSLSDCYYMSALAAIAKYPYLILDLFVLVDIEKLNKIRTSDRKKLSDPKIIKELIVDFSQIRTKSNYFESLTQLNEFYLTYLNSLKCFILKIRLHGEWNYIIIDSYFPIYSDFPSLIFGRSNSFDLWVSLVEKVWAKVLGGYYKTSLGSPSEGFLSLTDSPTDVINHCHLETSEELWEKIKVSINEEWILSCIIQLKGNKTKYYQHLGLITNHCYTILRIKQVIVKGKVHRFILLRNPHGHTSYSGNYSEEDSKWTTELKKAVDFHSKDEASFFMHIDDYFKFFDHTFVCKHEEGKVYKSYKVSKQMLKNNISEGALFLVNVKQEGKICFTLHQKYKKVYGKGIKNKLAQVIISKVNDLESMYFEYICGSNGCKSVNVSNFFEKGTYILYSRIETGIEKKIGFVVSTYCDVNISSSIEFSLVSGEIDTNLILEKILVSMCQSKLQKTYYPPESKINSSITNDKNLSYKIATLNECDNGFVVIFFENKNKDACINANLTIKDFTGLEFVNLKNKIINNQLAVTTAPLSQNLIYFKKKKMKCGFQITFNETFSYTLNFLKTNIKKQGDKKEVLVKNWKSGVVIYSIGHGNGYLFMLENTSKKEATLKIIFTKMDNLKSKLIGKDGGFQEVLKPISSSYLELYTIESGKPISIAYKYAASLK